MSITIQQFLSTSAAKSSSDLLEAFARIPPDKRTWSPEGKARSAGDIIAECAMLNGNSAKSITNKEIDPNMDFEAYFRDKARLAEDWKSGIELLKTNSELVVAAIASTPDEALSSTIQSPWGPMPFTTLISYAYWNMSYHVGQINYIASMLGTLD